MKKPLLKVFAGVLLLTTCIGCSSENVQKGTEYVTDADAVNESSAEVSDAATISDSVEESDESDISGSEDSAEAEVTETAVEIDPSEDVIVFIGDSQFANAKEEGSSIPSLTGLILDANVYNLAIGGTTAAITNGDDYVAGETYSNTFINIANAISGLADPDSISDENVAKTIRSINPEDVDFYVIEYGYNDFISKVAQSDNDTAYDYHLYSDALYLGINTLKNVSPNAQFILCGPSYCLVYDNNGQYLGDGNITDLGYGTLADYANTCNGVANGLGITYIDTYYGTEFDLNGYSVDSYTEDGLHFNETGRQIYATVIAHYINKLKYDDVEELDVIQISKFTFEYY